MKNFVAIQAFFSYIGRFKAAFWLTAAMFALADIVISLIPWLIGQLTHSLTDHGSVVLWTTLLIVASVGHDLIWRASEFMYLYKLQPRGIRFDDAVFEAVVHHSYGYFVDKFTGKISSYTNTLGREFRELMDNFQYNYVNLVVGMPIIAATMFTVNVYTGVIFIASLVLMFLVGKPLAKRVSKAERKNTDERSSIDGLVVDAIANFVSIKAFGNEKREVARLFHKRGAVLQTSRASYSRSIWFWGVMSLFVRWIIWPSTFILNIYLYVHGSIGLGQVATFLAAVVLFSNFIWEVIWYISQLNIKLSGIEEAYRYLFGNRNIFKDPVRDSRPPQLADFTRSLELKDLSFAYPDKPAVKVLDGIDLKIRRGEKIGIVGPSGGGKSTFLKLLLGYYPILQGQLLVDGKATNNQALTELTAYVPQDTAVFHRSIADNIAYGKQDATMDDIMAAAKHAQAHEFVLALDAGYDTLVGERGIKLSGGQRQRIAIARAILKDAPLLMLDEATSALDSESEKLIQKALWDLMEGRTAIVIAHRLSTIQKMDRILVMDRGKIVEQGTHQELLERQGVYAKLWSHQSGGFIEE